jgi:hypothetical protein
MNGSSTMTYSSPPPPTYYSAVNMNNSRPYSPILEQEFNHHHIDSPTYSFSCSSNSSQAAAETYQVQKIQVLSPLPDSLYDAASSYFHQQQTGLSLLTPPAMVDPHPYYIKREQEEEEEYYHFHNPQHQHQEQHIMCCPPPPPPAPIPQPTCYTSGCDCGLNNSTVFYNNGMMSPNPTFYNDAIPAPFNNNMLPPPLPLPASSSMHHQIPAPVLSYTTTTSRGYNKRQYTSKQVNRHHSLDSNSSTEKSTSSSSASTPRRYKCTLCVKRFTRPSSLATHMHSHTGEVT